MTAPLPPPRNIPQYTVSVIVMRPADTLGSICVLAHKATRKRMAQYRCACCGKGLVLARRGFKCKMQACGAEVVDLIRRPDMQPNRIRP